MRTIPGAEQAAGDRGAVTHHHEVMGGGFSGRLPDVGQQFGDLVEEPLAVCEHSDVDGMLGVRELGDGVEGGCRSVGDHGWTATSDDPQSASADFIQQPGQFAVWDVESR
ncbi:hypothetical protein [Streptomyces sp. AC627_RSS907]|uniref:hypothetical protein n=1 Tax=Streptomyces sp. AC627_RSS907 TaxID=2823684 RepID=UPI001C224233